MNDNIKEFGSVFKTELNKANKILLHCHPKPDPDSVGSALAMKLALEQIGKKVTLISGDSNIPKAFDFPAVNTILNKNISEIDLNDYELFIILDSSTPQMISAKYPINFPENLNTIVIDHHISNTRYAKMNFVNADYPSTAYILFDLFKEIGIKLDHDIALNLFIGIYTDTGGFKYGKINKNTFTMIAELVDYAPDFTKTIFTMENSNSKSSLIFEGLAISSLKEYFNGKVAIVSVNNKTLIENEIKEDDYSASDIVNRVKSVIGFDIAISAIESEPGIVKLSFRTRNIPKYDLSKIATALGGGGHRGAAGARLNMTMEKAIEKVVENIGLIYNF